MASIKRMPIGLFVAGLRAAIARKDGYIMGAKGQNPKKWTLQSWYFIQYKDRDNYTEQQEAKALYWREHAQRVWDCNGLAEGLYKEYAGVNIDTKARYNYSGWCSVKGTGMIPASQRAPGMAVFWGKSAASISHVAYLLEPVDPNNPAGDWYIGEARGVLFGCVQTRLYQRKPGYWGKMEKYFDYGAADYVPAEPELGEVILRNGMEDRADVKQLQLNLIELGFDCGKWGADGDFGDATELALMEFQRVHGCEADGKYGPETHAAMEKALAALAAPASDPKKVRIVGGNCWVRTEASTSGEKLGVAHKGDRYDYAGQTAENGWKAIRYDGKTAWVSGKYSTLVTVQGGEPNVPC